MLKWKPDLSLPLIQSTLRLKKTTPASVCGVALPLLIQGDGVIHNAETNTLQLINYKEIDMEVWKPDDEEDLHTLSKRDIKVWKYFGWTALYSIALILVLELFA